MGVRGFVVAWLGGFLACRLDGLSGCSLVGVHASFLARLPGWSLARLRSLAHLLLALRSLVWLASCWVGQASEVEWINVRTGKHQGLSIAPNPGSKEPAGPHSRKRAHEQLSRHAAGRQANQLTETQVGRFPYEIATRTY